MININKVNTTMLERSDADNEEINATLFKRSDLDWENWFPLEAEETGLPFRIWVRAGNAIENPNEIPTMRCEKVQDTFFIVTLEDNPRVLGHNLETLEEEVNNNDIQINEEISFEDWGSDMESYLMSFIGWYRRNHETTPQHPNFPFPKDKQWVEWMQLFMEFLSQDTDKRMEINY